MTLKEDNNGFIAPLYGLVLAGGRSVRMGEDKHAIKWHGKEQQYYMADMLRQYCTQVFISCRPEQQSDIDTGYKTIVDSVEGGGPLVAILSALKDKPGLAWLVVACDMPMVDELTLSYLVSHRNTDFFATTFSSPHDGLPEPLITIWEPAAYPVLLAHIADGFKCPRKALIRNSDRVNMLIAPDPDALRNANTPEDAAIIKELMK